MPRQPDNSIVPSRVKPPPPEPRKPIDYADLQRRGLPIPAPYPPGYYSEG